MDDIYPISEISDILWSNIRKLVKKNCSGCDINSMDYLHSCQKLYIDYYLFDQGYLEYFYNLYFDISLFDILTKYPIKRLTRYKKDKLRVSIFSYLFERFQNSSLF